MKRGIDLLASHRKNGADTMLRFDDVDLGDAGAERAAFSLAPFCCPRGIPGRDQLSPGGVRQGTRGADGV